VVPLFTMHPAAVAATEATRGNVLGVGGFVVPVVPSVAMPDERGCDEGDEG
jgi:hypothetical protein